MFHVDKFPNDLIQQYLQACNKLKKFERFKRFAPNVAGVSSDFNRLALKFEEACIYQYAAMCFLGASKCEKSLGNHVGETNYLLKSAKSFIKANDESDKLLLRTNKREYIEGALKSYSQALCRLEDDSVIKAAVIREIKKLNPSFDGTSSFSSPCHRIFDLELSANENIKSKDYVAALEKLTDIFDNITERKKERLYIDVLDRIQIARLFLLLLLELPPARQSPSHIKLLERYSRDLEDEEKEKEKEKEKEDDNINEISNDNENNKNTNIPKSIHLALKDLTLSWQKKDKISLCDSIEELIAFNSLTKQHKILLNELLFANCV